MNQRLELTQRVGSQPGSLPQAPEAIAEGITAQSAPVPVEGQLCAPTQVWLLLLHVLQCQLLGLL